MSINLVCNLLSMDLDDDYVKIAEQLRDSESDVKNMLNFMLCLVCDGPHLSNPNATLSNANWHAR